MPYQSDAQRRFFNSPTGLAKIGAAKVHEFNEASKGMELPERKKPSKSKPATDYGAMVRKANSYA
jgi:hypothetical protein